jgi:hypothetical protein
MNGPDGTNGRGDEMEMVYTTTTGETEIDFILYEPSPSWTAAGTTLLLDDQDEWTTFSGSWNQTRREYGSSNTTFPTGNPLRGTISQAREPGATFKAIFVGKQPQLDVLSMTKHTICIGSRVQVYGALQQVPGTVTIDYAIDGSFSETVTLSPNSQDVNRTNWELNRLLFGHTDRAFYGDEKTEHTLEVTVKEVTGDQVCSISYVWWQNSLTHPVAC